MSLYERAAMPGGSSTDVFLSAEAFQRLADLAGRPCREIVRRLPDPSLNTVPARKRGR